MTGGYVIREFEGRNSMDLQIRRVVTGHNADGRAVVKIDEICRNLISTRKGQQSCLVWTTDSAPANNDTDEDASQRATTARTRSTTRSCSPARSTWNSMAIRSG